MSAPTWTAPRATGPVIADVRVPGSKSMTNRALVLSALADGRSTLHRPLRSRDSAIMVAALRALGVTVDDSRDETWTVDGGQLTSDPGLINVGNAGTVLRFTPSIAALTRTTISYDGEDAIRRRPVAPLLDALRELGAEIDDGGRGRLPFAVQGHGSIRGGKVSLDASSSSQLVSALLLAGAAYDDGVEIHHVGDRPVPNAPHLAMSAAMVAARGVVVVAYAPVWRVEPGPIAATETAIEPDLSSAAPFAAAAAVTQGRVRILDWPLHSTQPGAQLPSLLEAFGATTTLDGNGLVVVGGATVTGADLDLRNAGELTPVLAAVAALASSPSRLTGIDYLRGHETDRLAALVNELTAVGVTIRELDDGLEIIPKPLHGSVFSTYDDHRMVMAGAVVGLAVDGVEIADVATVGKTLPDFTALWTDAVTGIGVEH